MRTLSSDQPRSNFDQQKIEQAAQLIIKAEGIINPLIVSRTGINSFQVVDAFKSLFKQQKSDRLRAASKVN